MVRASCRMAFERVDVAGVLQGTGVHRRGIAQLGIPAQAASPGRTDALPRRRPARNHESPSANCAGLPSEGTPGSSSAAMTTPRAPATSSRSSPRHACTTSTPSSTCAISSACSPTGRRAATSNSPPSTGPPLARDSIPSNSPPSSVHSPSRRSSTRRRPSSNRRRTDLAAAIVNMLLLCSSHGDDGRTGLVQRVPICRRAMRLTLSREPGKQERRVGPTEAEAVRDRSLDS